MQANCLQPAGGQYMHVELARGLGNAVLTGRRHVLVFSVSTIPLNLAATCRETTAEKNQAPYVRTIASQNVAGLHARHHEIPATVAVP